MQKVPNKILDHYLSPCQTRIKSIKSYAKTYTVKTLIQNFYIKYGTVTCSYQSAIWFFSHLKLPVCNMVQSLAVTSLQYGTVTCSYQSAIWFSHLELPVCNMVQSVTSLQFTLVLLVCNMVQSLAVTIWFSLQYGTVTGSHLELPVCNHLVTVTCNNQSAVWYSHLQCGTVTFIYTCSYQSAIWCSHLQLPIWNSLRYHSAIWYSHLHVVTSLQCNMVQSLTVTCSYQSAIWYSHLQFGYQSAICNTVTCNSFAVTSLQYGTVICSYQLPVCNMVQSLAVTSLQYGTCSHFTCRYHSAIWYSHLHLPVCNVVESPVCNMVQSLAVTGLQYGTVICSYQ